MKPSQRQLDFLVQRIVDTVHPIEILLFGSLARGEAGASSDIDLLVVMPEGALAGSLRKESTAKSEVLVLPSMFWWQPLVTCSGTGIMLV